MRLPLKLYGLDENKKNYVRSNEFLDVSFNSTHAYLKLLWEK